MPDAERIELTDELAGLHDEAEEAFEFGIGRGLVAVGVDGGRRVIVQGVSQQSATRTQSAFEGDGFGQAGRGEGGMENLGQFLVARGQIAV